MVFHQVRRSILVIFQKKYNQAHQINCFIKILLLNNIRNIQFYLFLIFGMLRIHHQPIQLTYFGFFRRISISVNIKAIQIFNQLQKNDVRNILLDNFIQKNIKWGQLTNSYQQISGQSNHQKSPLDFSSRPIALSLIKHLYL